MDKYHPFIFRRFSNRFNNGNNVGHSKKFSGKSDLSNVGLLSSFGKMYQQSFCLFYLVAVFEFKNGEERRAVNLSYTCFVQCNEEDNTFLLQPYKDKKLGGGKSKKDFNFCKTEDVSYVPCL